MTLNAIIGACKELIFDLREGKPIFHAIMYYVNPDSVEIELSSVFEISMSDDGEDIYQEMRDVLAIAAIEDVPVYPNNDGVALMLAEQHKKMLIHGFTAPDEAGGRVRLMLTDKALGSINFEYPYELDSTASVTPAMMIIMAKRAREELQRRDHAGQILSGLQLAIEELTDLLGDSTVDEHSLQRCITRNPILFGTQYARVIPKHRLGAEYEVDYALEQTNGLVDVVEIEPSSFSLFNLKGDPTSKLVHAEQQVFDWLRWMERHNSYAREGLSDVYRPKGYVVIGRSQSDDSEARLRQRNRLFRGDVEVFTYDDLLRRASNLLEQLEGAAR